MGPQRRDEMLWASQTTPREPCQTSSLLELPEVGEEVNQGEQLGVVESVKAAGDVYAPMSGTIVAVNEELEDAPELVNEDPYGKGWLVRIEPSAPGEWNGLLSVDAYKEVVEREQAE